MIAQAAWLLSGMLAISAAAREHERYLLGRIRTVCMIESSIERDGESISGRYLYSPVDGLLVMEFRSRKGAESFERTFLARGIGFGSEAQKQ